MTNVQTNVFQNTRNLKKCFQSVAEKSQKVDVRIVYVLVKTYLYVVQVPEKISEKSDDKTIH